MKKLLVLVMSMILAFLFAGCGEDKNATVTENVEKSTVESAEVAETGTDDFETVVAGNIITTDFVELTITEAGMANSLKTSIKTGNYTRIFGPEDSAETDFAYIKGTIMNKSTSTVSTFSDEIKAIAKVGEYTLEEDDLYIYKSDGDTVRELSPLVEYNFMMCVEIPNALVESGEVCNFNFAFNETFESTNSEINERDYKYSLEIATASEAPAAEASSPAITE